MTALLFPVLRSKHCSGFGLLVRVTHGLLMAAKPSAHVLSKLFGIKNDAGKPKNIKLGVALFFSFTVAVHIK